MGKVLQFEKNIEDYLNQLFQSQFKLLVGLILGQQGETKDFGVHLVRCPDPVDDNAVEMPSSCEEDDDQSTKNNNKNSELGKNSTNGAAFQKDSIDMKWVVEHGRQVNRMLSGGINVLGMFIYCSPETLAKNQAKIPQCLHNLNIKNKWLRRAFNHNERYLLHVCSTTKKLTCRTVDISLIANPTLKPANFQFQSFLNSWNSVSTIINTSVNICIPLSKKSSIENAILHACQDEIESIWETFATVNHKLVNDNELLNDPKTQKNKQVKPKEIDITLFKAPKSLQSEKTLMYESANLEIKFYGSIQSKAFLHAKATWKDAINALKIDIIRSLLTRIELLCEEAEVNNLDDVDEWSLVSPTRVFVPYENSQLLFCDYSFKDESYEDITSRFTELLNVNPLSKDLIFVERSPEISEVSMILHTNDKASDQQSDIASEISQSLLEESSNHRFIFILIAILMVLIGIAFHLVFN